jgi:hypothetical protein
VSDVRIATVALEGLENILKTGEAVAKAPGGDGQNPYAQMVEDAEGLDKIEALQVGGLGWGGVGGRGGARAGKWHLMSRRCRVGRGLGKTRSAASLGPLLSPLHNI